MLQKPVCVCVYVCMYVCAWDRIWQYLASVHNYLIQEGKQ